MIKKRIFLSHTAQDKPLIERLAIALRDYGFEVWFDKWEIKVGDSIVSKINDGLHASDLLLVALSKGSVESDWVKEELNTALMRQLSKKNIQVLPALIEPCDIPPLLEHRRYVGRGLQGVVPRTADGHAAELPKFTMSLFYLTWFNGWKYDNTNIP